MDEKRHNGGRDGSVGGNSKIVSLLETERSRVPGGDRGFAEGDRRRKSIAFRGGDGGTGRSQRFAEKLPSIHYNKFHRTFRFCFLSRASSCFILLLFVLHFFACFYGSTIERSISLVSDAGKQGSFRFDSETTMFFTCSTDTNGDNSFKRCSTVESRSEESRGDKSSSIHEHRFESDFVVK